MADISADITTKAVLEGGYTNFGSFSGQLEKPGDHDWIKVTLEAGKTYGFFASFLNTDSFTTGDSTLSLRDATGAELKFMDDGGVGFNSYLSYNITISGTYFIDIGELNNNNSGNYRTLHDRSRPARATERRERRREQHRLPQSHRRRRQGCRLSPGGIGPLHPSRRARQRHPYRPRQRRLYLGRPWPRHHLWRLRRRYLIRRCRRR